MKISKADYNKLSIAINKVLNDHPLAKDEYKKKGLSKERFMWDVLFQSNFFIISLYRQNINDSHIQTALNRIIKDY